MALSENALKRLAVALGDPAAANEIAKVLDRASEADVLKTEKTKVWVLVETIEATATSQTTDFAKIKNLDRVVMVPATAGSADYIEPTVDGDLGQAAVVGNLYLVFREITIPADAAVKF